MVQPETVPAEACPSCGRPPGTEHAFVHEPIAELRALRDAAKRAAANPDDPSHESAIRYLADPDWAARYLADPDWAAADEGIAAATDTIRGPWTERDRELIAESELRLLDGNR